MILSKEELEARLNSSSNLIRIMEEDKKNPTVRVIKWAGCEGGRNLNKPNMTEEERIATGVLARTLSPGLAAEVMGVSYDHAANLSTGNGSVRPEIVKAVDEATDTVRKTVESKAAERLLASLGFLTDDKMSQASAKDISTIATNMSRTMANMRPKEQQGDGRKISVVIHANKQAKEEHFEIIEVSA